MSFAAGFQAGSGAVERGLRLRAMREEKENQEAFQAAAAGLSQQYQAGQQAQAQYGVDQQTALDNGMALASPVPPSGDSANPLLAGAAGTYNPQMSPALTPNPISSNFREVGIGGTGQPANVMPQTAYMTPPEAMSYTQYQRGLADLAMKFGNTDTALSLMSAAEAADRNERLEAMRRAEFAQTQGLAVRAQDLADLQYSDQKAEALRVRTFEEGQRKATRELLMMVNQGKPMSEIQDFITKNEFLDGATAMTTVTNAFNLNEQEIQAEQSRIRDQVADMTWEELKKAHIDDENISKGEHYDIVFNEESGLYDVVVFNTNNVTGETESGEKTYERKRVLGSTEDFGAAVNDLRTLAYDRGTAVESLTNKAVSRRSKAAEAKLKAAERALEKYGMDKDYDEAVLKEVSAGIRELRENGMFAALPQAEQDAAIRGVYDSLGVAVPTTMGLKPVEDEAEAPVLGAGAQAIEDAKAARAEAEKGQRTVTSEAERILDQRVRGPFGLMGDQELYDIGYNAATPEVQAEIDRILEAKERAAQQVSGGGRFLGLGGSTI